MVGKRFKSTAEIKTSKKIIDQVLGQEDAVEVCRKAAGQRRHVFLIGEPGTGKSMLGLALAEMLPKEKLVDILAFPNPNDENQPIIRTLPAGKGRELALKSKLEVQNIAKNARTILLFAVLLIGLSLFWTYKYFNSDVIFAAVLIVSSVIIVGLIIMMNLGAGMGRRIGGGGSNTPKVIVDNFGRKQAPFYDATGAHAGALLGDVLHDPFQSGGLGTPANERVVAGMIHKAHLGVLFIDEIATLAPHTQQELLTALQEGRFSITGQSERSAGAMVRTEPVPCNFVLIAAGNLETLKHMHPALRSRIRGYGYEVYMKETMEDTPQNRDKIATFIAQEVNKDGKIPHFSYKAYERILEEARRRANRKGHLTLRLRELGGLVRAAGDVANAQKAKLVEPQHINQARTYARSLEKQITDRATTLKKEYEVLATSGKRVGRVNGLSVFMVNGSLEGSGIVQPIEAQVAPGGERTVVNATGRLGEIAKESVTNVSAIIMRYFGEDIRKKHDIYLQFLQSYEGLEGDSASIAIATAIISALKDIPIRQDVAMTGSLSVRGQVLPVGGVSSKVEAAIQTGIKTIIVPKSNLKDIVIDQNELKKVKIVPVEHIREVLKEAMIWTGKTKILAKINKQ